MRGVSAIVPGTFNLVLDALRMNSMSGGRLLYSRLMSKTPSGMRFGPAPVSNAHSVGCNRDGSSPTGTENW